MDGHAYGKGIRDLMIALFVVGGLVGGLLCGAIGFISKHLRWIQ